jgi:ATP-dependent Lon protease
MSTKQEDVTVLIEDRIVHIRSIIRNTILSIQNYKKMNIFSNSDVAICMSTLTELYESTNDIMSRLKTETIDTSISSLQKIIDKMSLIISGYGTQNMDDLLYITFGSEFANFTGSDEMMGKFALIKKHIHPTGYKIITSKTRTKTDKLCLDKIGEAHVIDKSPMLECFDYDKPTASFQYKVGGVKLVLVSSTNKTMVITGIVDEINVAYITNPYIARRMREIETTALQTFLGAMTLKDILINGNGDIAKISNKILMTGVSCKRDKLETTISKFTDYDMCGQRNMIIELLLCDQADMETQYIAYLLYDLLASNVKEGLDSNEQVMIYDSMSWKIKCLFKDAMKHTIKYTQQISQKYDISRVSLEQQVYLMRVPDAVKDRAIVKLKEIKGKSDESGAKARQYLEGLLKIPFGIHREEPIMRSTKDMNAKFANLIESSTSILPITKKTNYTNVEIGRYLNDLGDKLTREIGLDKMSVAQINSVISQIVSIPTTLKTKAAKITEINRYLETATVDDKLRIFQSLVPLAGDIQTLTRDLVNFRKSIGEVEEILDGSVHGHEHAKKQLTKVVCQWISGTQTGYSFGFEGSPGVGKTSLAKNGLSQCLKDENGEPRPFFLIALGGSCNGSSLQGHGYKYVNSIWGEIAQAAMDAKCMNFIILFDEVDKISNTEQGKEITGILTHLIDPTQNDQFQDKYFNGVPIDLSKGLFIFSYNDPNKIDSILLDRIHRVKFDNLTTDDKLVIARKYIIPEIETKMGFSGVVEISDEIILEIVNSYTMEPGVRKFKEIMYDLFGEINIELLKHEDIFREIPVVIKLDDLENKYLKKKSKVREKKIHDHPTVGTICGLWANALGKGGIIPIEVSSFPSSVFMDLKLTGMQGDVMKESMNVAKTLAFSLCDEVTKKRILEEYKNKGIHIHTPDGATNKDGPSAGTAETTAIYSLLTNRPILNTVAITGEMDLNGNVTAIGGLEHKIDGGIRAGVTKFLFPKENAKEFKDYMEKHTPPANIEFVEVSTIQEVFPHVFI